MLITPVNLWCSFDFFLQTGFTIYRPGQVLLLFIFILLGLLQFAASNDTVGHHDCRVAATFDESLQSLGFHCLTTCSLVFDSLQRDDKEKEEEVLVCLRIIDLKLRVIKLASEKFSND